MNTRNYMEISDVRNYSLNNMMDVKLVRPVAPKTSKIFTLTEIALPVVLLALVENISNVQGCLDTFLLVSKSSIRSW